MLHLLTIEKGVVAMSTDKHYKQGDEPWRTDGHHSHEDQGDGDVHGDLVTKKYLERHGKDVEDEYVDQSSKYFTFSDNDPITVGQYRQMQGDAFRDTYATEVPDVDDPSTVEVEDIGDSPSRNKARRRQRVMVNQRENMEEDLCERIANSFDSDNAGYTHGMRPARSIHAEIASAAEHGAELSAKDRKAIEYWFDETS